MRGLLKFAETIQDAYNKGWVLAVIAEAQAKNGDIDGATVTIQRALKAVEMIQEAYDKVLVLVRIAGVQAKNGGKNFSESFILKGSL